MKQKLDLDPGRIAEARGLAKSITAPILDFIDDHTTMTVERSTLRLLGADGANPDGVPVPNLIVDELSDRLSGGIALWYVNAILKNGGSPSRLNAKIAEGLKIASLPLGDRGAIERKAAELVGEGLGKVSRNKEYRAARLEEWKDRNGKPLLYVIVATGNIYEDVKQAQAAALRGADVVAVIRTTAQSLLDYVPYGATTEGFGGTYATQENFRIMSSKKDGIVNIGGFTAYRDEETFRAATAFNIMFEGYNTYGGM